MIQLITIGHIIINIMFLMIKHGIIAIIVTTIIITMRKTKLTPYRHKHDAANSVRRWSWWTDSNPRPADYKSAALPTELHQHLTGLTIIAERQLFVNTFLTFFPNRNFIL